MRAGDSHGSRLVKEREAALRGTCTQSINHSSQVIPSFFLLRENSNLEHSFTCEHL